MKFEKKITLDLTEDERMKLDQAQGVLATIIESAKASDMPPEEIYDIFDAADNAYRNISKIFCYVKEKYM